MSAIIAPNAWVLLSFPSGHQRLVHVQPNTTIHVGKFGSFPANSIIFRPYHLTFELLDAAEGEAKSKLRIIPATELIAEQLEQHQPIAAEAHNDTGTVTPKAAREDSLTTDGGVEYDIVADDGTVLIRSNRLTVDDPSRQKLSYQEIEALKKAEKGGGREIIAAILKNHAALDEKTSFSLHKYTVKKKHKYLRRFSVLPLDVARLCGVLQASNPQRILEIRDETLALLMSWSNARKCGGRWLVVDDTGGLLVAAMAERMGILHNQSARGSEANSGNTAPQDTDMVDAVPDQESGAPTKAAELAVPAGSKDEEQASGPDGATPISKKPGTKRPDAYQAAETDTITVLHPAAQPNVSILKYFGFAPESQDPSHPLYSHLKTLSWLSLLTPESDPSLREPQNPTPDVWESWKSGRQSSHRKKRRRWERMLKLVAETRQGGFDGLIVASGGMDLAGIFRGLVPLVKGGGQVVCFGATLEPMSELTDLYSRERRAAFTTMENERVAKEEATALTPSGRLDEEGIALHADEKTTHTNGMASGEAHSAVAEQSHALTEHNLAERYPFLEDHTTDREDFPVNPLLLLAPTLQTVRAKHWQVLPGRTHPRMMERGGAEGYIFTAVRVIPVQGRIEARGRFQKGKKRKAEDSASAPVTEAGGSQDISAQ